MSMSDDEIDALSEELRREIRERMDVFMHDARDLARKYLGADRVAADPTLAFPIAAALSQHFAAHIVANALRELTKETKLSNESARMLAALQKGKAR
jgi:hypothetical protein